MSSSPEYKDRLPDGPSVGRGAGLNPGNRFESVRLHVLGDHLDQILTEQSEDRTGKRYTTQVFRDHSRTIINPVDSPDVGFDWSINPYRGCEHGCIYCYARPFHEMLGMSCGLDFETKILAKTDAPDMLRKELAHPRWIPGTIAMSGVTDCYQPIESKLKITRRCLAVMAECRQPVGIVTKNRLVTRDLDLLEQMSRYHCVRVAISVTTLDPKLAAIMESRASSPNERLKTITKLHRRGIPVIAMVAPVIPGINDRQIPQILSAVADAGAQSASYVLLRLPYQIKDLFIDWLDRHFPDRAQHVQTLIRDCRGGELYDGTFWKRMRGEGDIAKQIGEIFRVFTRRYRLDRRLPPMSNTAFRPPMLNGQMRLFE